MQWDQSLTAMYYACVVDPKSWMDTERLEIPSDGGSTVKKTYSDLREAANIKFDDFGYDKEIWIRVWLDAFQGNEASHQAIFTGLACAPKTDIDGYMKSVTTECYSVLKPAQDVLLPRGWYAPEKADAGVLIKRLLRYTPAPVIVDEGIPQLTSNIIAEEGENALSMVDNILSAVGWRLKIEGNGQIHVSPLANKSLTTMDSTFNDIVEQKLDVTYDYYECPNVLRVSTDTETYEARDDDPNSICSTVSRGREIWAEESNCDLSTGESLAYYAKRRLSELQQTGYIVNYSRRFIPDIYPTDIVTLHYPAQGIDGQFIITSQNLDIVNGCTVSEEVQRI